MYCRNSPSNLRSSAAVERGQLVVGEHPGHQLAVLGVPPSARCSSALRRATARAGRSRRAARRPSARRAAGGRRLRCARRPAPSSRAPAGGGRSSPARTPRRHRCTSGSSIADSLVLGEHPIGLAGRTELDDGRRVAAGRRRPTSMPPRSPGRRRRRRAQRHDGSRWTRVRSAWRRSAGGVRGSYVPYIVRSARASPSAGDVPGVGPPARGGLPPCRPSFVIVGW